MATIVKTVTASQKVSDAGSLFGAVLTPDGSGAGCSAILWDVAAFLDGVFSTPTLAISATAEKFKTTTVFTYRISNTFYSKAPQDLLVFSASHDIKASKFGVVLIQVNGAGTISTKVVGATQTTQQAYNTAALALAAAQTVSPDSGKVFIGYIAIENNTGDWIANTDDLTNGSDLTTAAFVNGQTGLLVNGAISTGALTEPYVQMLTIVSDGRDSVPITFNTPVAVGIAIMADVRGANPTLSVYFKG